MNDITTRNVQSQIPTQGVAMTLDTLIDTLLSQITSPSVSRDEKIQLIKNDLRTFLQDKSSLQDTPDAELDHFSELLASNVGYTLRDREGYENSYVPDPKAAGKSMTNPKNVPPYLPYYREKEEITNDPHTCDRICEATKKPKAPSSPYTPIREIALSDLPQTSLPLPSDSDGNGFVENVVVLVKNG